MSFLTTCASVLFARINTCNCEHEKQRLISFWCDIMDANGYNTDDICQGIHYIIDTLVPLMSGSSEVITRLLVEKIFNLRAVDLNI